MIAVKPVLSGRMSMSKIEAQKFLKAIAADKHPTVFVQRLVAEAKQVVKSGPHWVKE